MDLLLDAEGDLAFAQDDLVLVSDQREVLQEVTLRLTLRKGAWFADPDVGMLDFERWFERNPNLSQLSTDVRNEVLKVNGVLTVDPVRIEVPASRRATVRVTGTTADGPFEVAVSL